MKRLEKIREVAQSLHSFRMRDGFINGAMWADRHPHWISVEDELPPIDGGFSDEVLTYDSATNEYKIAQFNYISRCWFGCDDNVTHWMALSEPPKKGGEK